METRTDQEWIRQIKQNNSQAIADLWEMLYSCGLAITRRWNLDEDLGYQAAIQTYQRLMKYGIQQFNFHSQFKSYCWRILTNEVWRQIRRDQPAEISIEADPESTEIAQDEPPAGEHILHLLQPCIEKLARRDWGICRKFYLEGLLPQEIAGQTGITQNNVNVILHRTRSQLLKCLQQRGYHSAADVLGSLM